jgi:hypothetical protein
MSIREASCGRDSESWYYAGQSVRLAIEMGLHRLHDRGDEDELAVQAATFWGAFALDQYVSVAFRRSLTTLESNVYRVQRMVFSHRLTPAVLMFSTSPPETCYHQRHRGIVVGTLHRRW